MVHVVEASVGSFWAIVDRVVELRVSSSPIALFCVCVCVVCIVIAIIIIIVIAIVPGGGGRGTRAEREYRGIGRAVGDDAYGPAKIDPHSVGTRLEASHVRHQAIVAA